MSYYKAPSALQAQLWPKELMSEMPAQSFFYTKGQKMVGTPIKISPNVMSSGPDSIINVKRDLLKQKGDRINFGIGMNYDSPWVYSDGTLIGNEGTLTDHEDVVYIDQARTGVRLDGAMEEQKSSYDLRKSAKERLKLAPPTFIDAMIMRELSGDTTFTFANTGLAPDSSHIIYGGDATTKATIASADWFGVQEILRMVYVAKNCDPIVPPLKIGGKEWYVILIHSKQMYTLRADSDFKDYFKYAGVRGDENTLFSAAGVVIGGAIIHEYDNVLTFDDYGDGANLDAARAVLLGAQAGSLAWGTMPFWREDTTSKYADYGNKPGFAMGFTAGVKKNRFNSKDYGVVVCDTYATTPVGAAHS